MAPGSLGFLIQKLSVSLPPGLMSYTPCDCSEIVTEVVGPVSSKLEEYSRSGSYLSGCPGRGALEFLQSPLASHYWDQTLLFSIFSSLSGTIQEQKLKEGSVSDCPLTCEKQAQRSPDAVSHMDGKGLS